jgi:tetratricopeptide (TPR) repeat protein
MLGLAAMKRNYGVGLAIVLAALALLGCRTEPSGEVAKSDRAQAEAKPEEELQKIINEGEAANAEVEQWIAESEKDKSSADDQEAAKALSEKIQRRFGEARKGYEGFIGRYPKYGGGYAAYGDFLLGHYDEDGAEVQLVKALDLDRANATAYNDLANIYGHQGSVKEAFNYYAKAIKIDPTEPVYYENFATTVFLFRKDAKEYYDINEQQVFDKALLLYSNAMRLDPTNFALAADVAKSYYGIKPWRFEDALQSWTNALKVANNDLERQEVHTHFARILTQAGRYDEARANLNVVTDESYATLRERMLKNIAVKERDDTPLGKP